MWYDTIKAYETYEKLVAADFDVELRFVAHSAGTRERNSGIGIAHTQATLTVTGIHFESGSESMNRLSRVCKHINVRWTQRDRGVEIEQHLDERLADRVELGFDQKKAQQFCAGCEKKFHAPEGTYLCRFCQATEVYEREFPELVRSPNGTA